MRKTVIGLLLVSGFAMAATKEHVVAQQPHLSSWTREALSTQSPRIKFSKNGHHMKPGYRVVTSKGTINAFVPYGK